MGTGTEKGKKGWCGVLSEGVLATPKVNLLRIGREGKKGLCFLLSKEPTRKCNVVKANFYPIKLWGGVVFLFAFTFCHEFCGILVP